MVNSGTLRQHAYGWMCRIRDGSFAFRPHALKRSMRCVKKDTRSMPARGILLGAAGAIVFSALGIAGCNHEIKTHPPLDKRIENVENELRRMEKTQREGNQITDRSGRTNNAEY